MFIDVKSQSYIKDVSTFLREKSLMFYDMNQP